MALSHAERSANAKRAWDTIRSKYGPAGPPRGEARLSQKPELPKKALPKQDKKIKLPPAHIASIEEMEEKTVIFVLTFSAIGNHRKVDTENIELTEDNKTSDKEWLAVSKKLWDAEELTAITSLDGEVRRYIDSLALPFTIKKGIYLLPKALADEVDAKLTEYAKKRDALVKKLVDNYDDLIKEARHRLKNLFDKSQYPPPDVIRQSFRLTWRFMEIMPPSRQKLSEKLRKQEIQKTAASWEKARGVIQQMLRQNMAEMIEHLRERLTPGEDGKTKIFKENSFKKINEFLETFDVRNITEDRQLKVLVDKAKSLLKDTNADLLRSDEDVRAYVKYGFDTIDSALSSLITSKPSRILTLDE